MNSNNRAPVLHLSRVEQAAVLMMSLQRQEAAAVLRHLAPREVQRLSQAMASIRQVKREQLRQALDSFSSDVDSATGLGLESDNDLRTLLVDSVGENRADALFGRIAPQGSAAGFDTLKWLDAKTVADFIGREHPQIQALVVACLDATQAAEVMALLPEDQRLEIVMRVSELDSVRPAALQELNDLIEQEFSKQTRLSSHSIAGRRLVSSMLKRLDAGVAEHLLEDVCEQDTEMGAALEDLMFVFDDIAGLQRQDLTALLHAVAPDVLATALKGCGADQRERVLAVLPRRPADRLRATMSRLQCGQVDIEQAQDEILLMARRMAAVGEIILDPNARIAVGD